ncbi:MAG: TIGR02996 domain-containing protein, partial [Deltaproteobacteria bacterium]|nr:TIGR02996 domain-containing protein [Deltaproteobacteria bacterium]
MSKPWSTRSSHGCATSEPAEASVSDDQRLLAAIIESPDDDAPRLVYADWLQAQGDPLGELIQLQCRLAASPDDERRRAIKIAENKLFAAHGASWIAPVRDTLPAASELMPHKLEFVRGFIDEAQLTLGCVPHFEALWAKAPLIRRLRLSPNTFYQTPIKQPKLDGLLAAPQFARLDALDLQLGGAGNAAARVLAAAPTLANLRELCLHLSVWGEGIGMFEAGATELSL